MGESGQSDRTPEPCALWGVCIRPRGHDGPHTTTVEDAARLAGQSDRIPRNDLWMTCGGTKCDCHGAICPDCGCIWPVASAAPPEPPLDVERLLRACSRVGLELFPMQARAIARQYGGAAPERLPQETDG